LDFGAALQFRLIDFTIGKVLDRKKDQGRISILLIEAVEIPLVIGATAGINVFSSEIYEATHPEVGLPDYGMASTLSMLIVAVAVLLIILYWRLTKRAEKFATVTGKGFRPRLINLGKLKYLGLTIIFVYLAFSVLFPFLILLWGSFLPFYTPPPCI